MHRLLLLLSLVLLMAACQNESSAEHTPTTDSSEEAPSIPFRQNGTLDIVRDGEPLVTLAIEIADNDSSRTRGLMQRTSLPERSGMLFLFDQEEPQSFWMANTPLSLDLMFIGADSQIVDIAKYARPLSDDQIISAAPAQFVLEVPAGFTDSYGIMETDRVRWERVESTGTPAS